MRQPKFKMGETVTASVLVSNNVTGFTVHVPAEGIVCEVSYDPQLEAEGNPWYYYKVLIKDTQTPGGFAEDRLKEIP